MTLYFTTVTLFLITFTFMHLADAFIQSDLQCIQAIHVLSVYVFPGNRTHNLCAANIYIVGRKINRVCFFFQKHCRCNSYYRKPVNVCLVPLIP